MRCMLQWPFVAISQRMSKLNMHIFGHLSLSNECKLCVKYRKNLSDKTEKKLNKQTGFEMLYNRRMDFLGASNLYTNSTEQISFHITKTSFIYLSGDLICFNDRPNIIVQT